MTNRKERNPILNLFNVVERFLGCLLLSGKMGPVEVHHIESSKLKRPTNTSKEALAQRLPM
jgi:hypothetical protein